MVLNGKKSLNVLDFRINVSTFFFNAAFFRINGFKKLKCIVCLSE